MDAELKTEWCAALRSGKYKQSRAGFFKWSDGHCCLGVLCEVMGEPPMDNGEVSNWHIVNRVLPEKTQVQLYGMNDGNPFGRIKPHSFPEIADYIEKHL